MQALRH